MKRLKRPIGSSQKNIIPTGTREARSGIWRPKKMAQINDAYDRVQAQRRAAARIHRRIPARGQGQQASITGSRTAAFRISAAC
jgi:hypothetical protein